MRSLQGYHDMEVKRRSGQIYKGDHSFKVDLIDF
jgi:hypothetical protein